MAEAQRDYSGDIERGIMPAEAIERSRPMPWPKTGDEAVRLKFRELDDKEIGRVQYIKRVTARLYDAIEEMKEYRPDQIAHLVHAQRCATEASMWATHALTAELPAGESEPAQS